MYRFPAIREKKKSVKETREKDRKGQFCSLFHDARIHGKTQYYCYHPKRVKKEEEGGRGEEAEEKSLERRKREREKGMELTW